MRVAIPTNNPGGLEAGRSDHFGHCDAFTIVTLSPENKIEQVEILANGGHEAGGCLVPVQLLSTAGVEAIVVGGMGARPMQGFAGAGIKVYFANRETVPDVTTVIEHFCLGKLPLMHPEQVCQGSGNCQH
jgi:predicted Fe-Mo cluster-binding NifX family protein